MSKLNIAISPCPNDIFIFGHLIAGKIDWKGPELVFSFMDIQALNKAILASESTYELIKCSYAVIPEVVDRYNIFKVGAALGMGVGPLLVGLPDHPLSEKRVVYIPGYDTTAYRLFRRFGPKHLEVKELRYDLMMGQLQRNPDSVGVIIHESRFTYATQGLKLFLDLGQAWEEATQLPLPLGGPMVSKSLSDELVLDLEKAVQKSLQRAWQDRQSIEALLKFHAQELDMKVMAAHIQLYVNDYSLNLGSEGERAIQTLIKGS